MLVFPRNILIFMHSVVAVWGKRAFSESIYLCACSLRQVPITVALAVCRPLPPKFEITVKALLVRRKVRTT